MEYLPGTAANRSGTSPGERSRLQSTKMKGAGDLNSALTLDTEIQSLEFTLLVFSLPLVQFFSHYSPFPIFWNGNVCPVPLYFGCILSTY